MQNFKKGDRVGWNSCGLYKEGTIRKIVQPYELPGFYAYPRLHQKGAALFTRSHRSYVVKVDFDPKCSQTYYWPCVSKLKLL